MNAARHLTPTELASPPASRSSVSGLSVVPTLPGLPGRQYGIGARSLSDRQAVIAVMTANGRTRESIASKLRTPVWAVERYLYEALEILGVTALEDLTYPIIAAHFTRTSTQSPTIQGPSTQESTSQELGTGQENTPTLPATTPVRTASAHGTASSPVPASVVTPEPVPMSLSSVDNQSGADQFDGNRVRGSLGVLDAGEAVRVLELVDHDHHHVKHDRELAAAYELVERERAIVESLQKALRSRDVIGQAKGILMERHKITSDAASTRLQAESAHSNRKFIDVATQLTYMG